MSCAAPHPPPQRLAAPPPPPPAAPPGELKNRDAPLGGKPASQH
jgi:hypothetical protein